MTVKMIVSTALSVPVDRIPDDAKRGKLRGWDSLGHVAIVTAIEDRFAITLEQAEILAMTSIPEIHNVLRNKGVSV